MKKIICLILTVLILVMSVPCYFAEETLEEAVYQPTESELEAVEVLKGFGIINEGFNVSEVLTRAEFTMLLIKGMEEEVNVAAELPFADVTKDMESFNAVATAYSLGMVSAADLFNPDSPILLEHAYKMLVIALGYNIPASNKGGYSAGYGAIAGNLSLGKGANAEYGKALYGATAARLILNMLKAPIFVQTIYGTEERYESNRDSVYMSEALDIYEAEGVVTASTLTDLDGFPSSEFIVKIDGVKYYAGNSNTGLYLGQNIEFYYRKAETDSIATVLYAVPDDNKNEIVIIDASSVLKTGTTNSVISYIDEDDDIIEADLADDVDVVSNGKYIFGYNKETLTPTAGSLTLIDNDSDGEIDVVLVRSYKIGVVHSVSVDAGEIYMRFGAENIILKDYEAYSLSKDGSVCTVDKIAEWDIVSLAESDETAEIFVSSKSVSGTVKSVTTEDGKITEIEVDGGIYEVSKDYVEKSAELKTGISGVFYIGTDGRIAAAKLSTTERPNYAIYTNLQPGKGFGNEISLQFFTAAGKTEIMKAAEKVRVNGDTVKRENLAEKLTEAGAQYGLVTIDANTDGEITEINTPKDLTQIEGHIGYDEDNFSLDKTFSSVIINSSFGGCWMTNDTLFFSVPTDKTNLDLYKVENGISVYGSADVSYSNIKLYDLDRFNSISVIIYSNFDENISADTPEVDLWNQFFVISDIKTALDADGMERRKVCGYFEGKYTEYFVADGGAKNVTEMWKPDQGRMDNQVGKRGRSKWGFLGYTDANFTIGDVIQPELDAKGNLKYFRMLYSAKLDGVDVSFDANGNYGGDALVYYSPGEFYEINELAATQHHKGDPGYRTMCYTALGRVTDTDGSKFRFDTVIAMQENGVIVKYNVNRVMQGIRYFYIYDTSKKTVTQAAATDLRIGDKIFTHSRGYTLIIRD